MWMHYKQILVALGVSACSAASGDMGVVVRDSAGITLVEHTDGQAPIEWRL